MLRITITDTPTEQKWVLHGRLTEPWVAELRSNWEKTREARQGRKCVVDLDQVTFISDSGESALLAMVSEGARCVASGLCAKHLVKNLEKRCKN